MRKYHFISGLPRSGSTLLSSLLIQNPRFTANITSPMQAYVESLNYAAIKTEAFNHLYGGDRFNRVLKAVFDAHYADANEVCFDTARPWSERYDLVADCYPNAKIICCVRPLNMVLNSFEALYRKRGAYINKLFTDVNKRPDDDVYRRTEHLMNNVVGDSYRFLRSGYYGPYRKQFFILEYDNLVTQPEETMKKLYEFIDEPYYQHDFDNVQPLFDTAKVLDIDLGFPELHTVGKKVKSSKTPIVLPPDLMQRYANTEFWKVDSFSKGE